VTLRRRARCASEGESGAAMVELLVVLGVLVLLVFGIIEFGNGWKNKLEVETAARAGARVGSSLGNDRMADYGLLQSTKSALANLGLSNVEYVVVYKSTTTNGAVPAACSSSTPTSQTNVCNVYTGSQVNTLTQASFTGTTSCTGSSPDRFWCPVTRKNVQSQGADYIGIWIKADSATLTAFFGSPLEIQSRAVMRLEPK
jgi:Flp pilus assembly protein TadG